MVYRRDVVLPLRACRVAQGKQNAALRLSSPAPSSSCPSHAKRARREYRDADDFTEYSLEKANRRGRNLPPSARNLSRQGPVAACWRSTNDETDRRQA